jgi:hypothetical protein
VWHLLALETFSDVVKVGLRDDQTISGKKTFDSVADRDWSTVTPDTEIGDADEGILGIGGGYIGFADDVVSGLDLSDIFVLWSTEDAASDIAFMLVSPGDLPRFVVAEEGVDLATYNPRSLLIGPAATLGNVEANILCSTFFSEIDCDTGGTGADLGVIDDVEILGQAWVGGVEVTPHAEFFFTNSKCMTLEKPVDGDDNIPLWIEHPAITVTSMRCIVEGGTNAVGFLSDGTNALDTMTCTTSPVDDDGSIANAGFAEGERFEWDTTSSSGAPTWLNFCWTYTVD